MNRSAVSRVPRGSWRDVGKAGLAGILMAFALTANYQTGGSLPDGSPSNWARLLPSPALWAAAALIGGWVVWRYARAWRPTPGRVFLALLFGLTQVIGNAMGINDSLDFLLAGGLQTAVGVLCVLGWTLLGFCGLCLLENQLSSPFKERRERQVRLSWGRSFAVLLGIYLLWSVAFFPGDVSWDTYASLNSAFGLTAPTNAHPMLFNWILGGCVWLGRALLSDNLGMYLFVLLQATACAAVYAKAIADAEREGMHGLAWGFMLFYALTPAFGMYVSLGNKDTLLAAAFCLLLLQSGRALREETGLAFWVSYGLNVILVSLLRHGLALIAFPLGLAVALSSLRGKKRLIGLGPLTAALAIVLGFTCVLLPRMGVEASSPYEALCLPFQQTARVVRDEGDTLTQAQRDALNAVLDVEMMGSLYAPDCGDAVKALAYQHVLTGREQRTKLLDFLSVWKDMFFQHPRVYLEAFWALSQGYYTLPMGDSAYDMSLYGGVNQAAGTNDGTFRFTSPECLKGLREWLYGFGTAFRRLPLIGLVHQCGAYTWLMLGLLSCTLKKGRRKALPLVLAILCLVAGCTLSSVNGYFRYFLPVAAAAPVALAAVRRVTVGRVTAGRATAGRTVSLSPSATTIQ